jgi:hypothetical protein
MLLEKPIMLCKKKANNEDRLLAKYAFINPNVIWIDEDYLPS